MASGRDVVNQLGIVELVDVCREMERRSLSLFELLGSWVTNEADPATQRLLAEACHRHAWHAELWQTRTPTIPVEACPDPATEGSAPSEPSDGRVSWYRGELAALRAHLDGIRARLDPELDPSTARTIGLVDADLADLERRVLAS